MKAPKIQAKRKARKAMESLAPTPPDPTLPTAPFQLIIYGDGDPTIDEGTAVTQPDGSIDLVMPVVVPPPVGTPVQVIIYNPGDADPTIIEGTTGMPGADGSFPILTVP